MAALAAAVALLSACGGSSASNQTATFKSGYDPVANQFKRISIVIGSEIRQASSQSDAQLAARFHTFATRWQTQLSRLQTLKPPPSLATHYNTVAGAASRVESDLTGIVAAARTHNASAAKQGAASRVADIQTTKAASTKITNALGT